MEMTTKYSSALRIELGHLRVNVVRAPRIAAAVGLYEAQSHGLLALCRHMPNYVGHGVFL